MWLFWTRVPLQGGMDPSASTSVWLRREASLPLLYDTSKTSYGKFPRCGNNSNNITNNNNNMRTWDCGNFKRIDLMTQSLTHHGPKEFYDRMRCVITTRVICVGFEIFEINRMRCSRNDHLMLMIIKHTKPFQVNHIGQSCWFGRGKNGIKKWSLDARDN